MITVEMGASISSRNQPVGQHVDHTLEQRNKELHEKQLLEIQDEFDSIDQEE